MRVLKWVVERCEGRGQAQQSAIGWLPRYEDFDWAGLEGFGRERFARLTAVDAGRWREELAEHDKLFARLEPRVPQELLEQRRRIAEAL
jgi:phosphoenolpyruvate carboxykinase (GTP)